MLMPRAYNILHFCSPGYTTETIRQNEVIMRPHEVPIEINRRHMDNSVWCVSVLSNNSNNGLGYI